MTDLERRALLGDRKAQAECTENSIILPCPFCGGPAELKQLSGRWAVCCRNNCAGTRVFNDQARPLAAWNTRPTPPIGRCSTCKLQMAKDCEAYSFDDDGSCTGGPESDYFCAGHKPQETTP